MAITASLYVSQSSVVPGTPVTVACIVSNSTTGDVTVASLRPYITPSHSAAMCGSVAPSPPGVAIPNSGSVGLAFSFVAQGPQRSGDTQGAYTVSATIVCSDGSVVTPEAVTVQVGSLFDVAPSEGAMRFDSNLNSGLLEALQ